MISALDWTRLPGAEIIRPGLSNLAANRVTVESLLIEIAPERLRGPGIEVPPIPAATSDPEYRLFRLLEVEHGLGAHSQFNAWVRRLDSFCRALECRNSADAKRAEGDFW